MTSPADAGLIVPLALPPGLETLRRRAVPDATAGLAAHATVVYPFADPAALDGGIRSRLEAVISARPAFVCRLVSLSRWPGVLYVSVEPEAAFRQLHEDLSAAFPEFPSDNGGFEYVPHVTVAIDPAASLPETSSDPAWLELPVVRQASRVDLLVRTDGRWSVKWSFPRAEPESCGAATAPSRRDEPPGGRETDGGEASGG